MTLTGPYTAEQRLSAISTAALLTGVNLNRLGGNNRRLTFTIRPESDAFRAWDLHKPRRKAAVCWHGHALFMAYLFRILPSATLRTCHATYHGAQEFLDNYQSTAYHAGPLFPRGWRGWEYAAQCRCWQSNTFTAPARKIDHRTILRIVEGGLAHDTKRQ